MKKSLLALAVLGAFAGAASAQTNVTIYGKVDAGIQYSKIKVAGESESVIGLESGLNGGSRLGFKGSEDLGGGLSAIFALENGFNTDDGSLGQDPNQLFGRQAFVGVQGGFGAVKLGRQYTPVFLALDSVDPFATNLAGSMLNTFNSHGLRMNNTVNYSLPNLGGFYGQVAYGFGEVAGNTSANRQIGLNAGYANGPVNVVLAYHKAEDATGDASARTTFVGGTYDFGVAKAHAGFGDNRGDAAIVNALLPFAADDAAEAAIEALAEAAAFDEDVKTRDYMLGVSAPIGAGKVLGSFQRKDDRNSEAHFDLFAVGYIHNLSKRTNVYTSAGYGKWTLPGMSDVKTNVINVGLQHNF